MRRICLLLQIISLVSCSTLSEDFFITFCNNSDLTICIAPDFSYPEDSINGIKVVMDPANPCDEISSNTQKALWIGVGKKVSWYSFFDYSQNNYSGYISFYIMDIDVKNEGNLETIQNDYNILARYDIIREDMEYLNWKLYYPPTPEMSRIHMWLKDDKN